MPFATRRHPPRFWHRPSWQGWLLSPLAWLYSAGTALHRLTTRAQRAPLPVIAIGGVTIGGAGKTPVTIALTELLTQLGETPHIASRGYGATITTPTRVTADAPAAEVGDEPLLLARHAPTWVHPRRIASAHAAVASGASLLLLDDALQHHAIAKDITFLVLDTAYGLGNGLPLPAGPLREPLRCALTRADAVIALGDKPPAHLSPLRPVFAAILAPTPAWAALKDKPAIAFCGLARPEKFFAMCKSAGMRLVATHAFPDHYAFTAADLTRLRAEAEAQGATLVCTEKDYVKLSPEDRAHVTALPLALHWQDEPALTEFLRERLASLRNT